MNTYRISETMCKNSMRAYDEIQAADLKSAKIEAEKMQYFHETVMNISDQSGNILAYKIDGKSWIEV